MYKIEIKGSFEHLQRISTFLDNNHIKHNVVGDIDGGYSIEEIEESINWPF
ncbi:hypothetical protein [Maribacter algarum]|uniref:hypothetical protein n=1 Tax=Maribacter algarum (ex Zhang et al. 2020) TaxID=2578118 RepID=UPI001486A1C0|nr:hypothetical protein [Maribacter algarum]